MTRPAIEQILLSFFELDTLEKFCYLDFINKLADATWARPAIAPFIEQVIA